MRRHTEGEQQASEGQLGSGQQQATDVWQTSEEQLESRQQKVKNVIPASVLQQDLGQQQISEEESASVQQQESEQQQVVKRKEISVLQQDSEQQQASEELQTAKQRALEEPSHTILRFFIKLGVVCLTLWLIFTFAFGIRQMHGETMYPRLRDGDLILYYRLQQEYQNGDVVVFKVDDQTCVARIVAQEGDVVEVNGDGQLLVNGNVQDEEIFYPTEVDPIGITYPYTVSAGSYFMLYDFRTAGADSRNYGAVSQKDFCGKVITILRRRGI